MAGPDEEFIRKVVEAIEACDLDEGIDQARQIGKIARLMKLEPRDSMLLVFILSWVRAGMVMTTLKAVNASSKALKQAAQKNLEASNRLQVQSTARRFVALFVILGVIMSAVIGAVAGRKGAFSAGYLEGLQATHVLRDLLASPGGPAVAGLISGGELPALANCDKPGWTKRDDHCVPFGVIQSDGATHVAGWRIRR